MEEKQILEEQVLVVDVQFRPGQKIYYFTPSGKEYTTGDHVIIDTARGPEYGLCTGGNHYVPRKEVVPPLRPVLRKATPQDEKAVEQNRQTEQEAFRVCQEQIARLNLDMQLVSAECAFDGSKLLLFFTADERVDFRELVRELAGVFHTRIELRQIGVRDKARMVGGLGICGRPFCCATFLDDFQPVSIKMAKTQNLSLNPTKISGTCGRLMCCLKYEQDAYEDLIKNSPKEESFVDTPDGRGTVLELNLMQQKVKVRMEQNDGEIGVYNVSDIAVYRNGKAKKTDDPIPEDWAPISGAGPRPAKKFQWEDNAPSLEAIKFRYSTETVAEQVETVQSKPESQSEQEQKNEHRRNRRNRKPQAKQEKPAPAEKAKQEKPGAVEKTKKPEKKEKPAKPVKAEKPAKQPASENPAQEQAEPAAQKKHHRRFHHRRPKKKEGAQE